MSEDIKYEFTTIEALDNLIDYDKPLMYDSETIGLYGEIRLGQFYQRHFETVLMVEKPDPFGLVSILSKAHIVMHNAHYDLSCVQDAIHRFTKDTNSWVPDKFDCTFLLSRLYYYKQESFSFDKVVKYVTGVNPYGDNKKDMQMSDWSKPVLDEEQLNYAADDVIHLHDVYDKVKVQADDINYKLDILTTKYCLDLQNNGMPFNEELLLAKYRDNEKRIKEIALPINCNSYKQVRPYINSNMSDDHGLAVLSYSGNEKAKAVRETRKLTKQNSFLRKFLTTARNNTIFGKFKCSPRSGRTASEDQNLQQIPRSVKGIFAVPENGDLVIIHSDFSQAQLRLVCAITCDTAMETLFRAGKDIHNYVAEMLFGKDFTKEHRQISKTANFGLLFGAGVTTFIAILIKEAGLLLSEAEATKIKNKWLSLWKQVAAWQTRGIKDWKKGISWETPLGRRYISKMMTDQLAMQIQGAEAEVAKLAIHYMIPKLKELNPYIKFRNFIHDGYIFTCPNHYETYVEASKIIAEAMLEAWQEMSQSFNITDLPMPCTARVGWNWKDIEDDKFLYEVTV